MLRIGRIIASGEFTIGGFGMLGHNRFLRPLLMLVFLLVDYEKDDKVSVLSTNCCNLFVMVYKNVRIFDLKLTHIYLTKEIQVAFRKNYTFENIFQEPKWT